MSTPESTPPQTLPLTPEQTRPISADELNQLLADDARRAAEAALAQLPAVRPLSASYNDIRSNTARRRSERAADRAEGLRRNLELRQHLGSWALYGATDGEAPAPRNRRERRLEAKLDRRAQKKQDADIYARRHERIYGALSDRVEANPDAPDKMWASKKEREDAINEVKHERRAGRLTAIEAREKITEYESKAINYGADEGKRVGKQAKKTTDRFERAQRGNALTNRVRTARAHHAEKVAHTSNVSAEMHARYKAEAEGQPWTPDDEARWRAEHPVRLRPHGANTQGASWPDRPRTASEQAWLDRAHARMTEADTKYTAAQSAKIEARLEAAQRLAEQNAEREAREAAREAAYQAREDRKNGKGKDNGGRPDSADSGDGGRGKGRGGSKPERGPKRPDKPARPAGMSQEAYDDLLDDARVLELNVAIQTATWEKFYDTLPAEVKQDLTDGKTTRAKLVEDHKVTYRQINGETAAELTEAYGSIPDELRDDFKRYRIGLAQYDFEKRKSSRS